MSSLSTRPVGEVVAALRAEDRDLLLALFAQMRSGRGFLNDLSPTPDVTARIDQPTLVIATHAPTGASRLPTLGRLPAPSATPNSSKAARIPTSSGSGPTGRQSLSGSGCSSIPTHRRRRTSTLRRLTRHAHERSQARTARWHVHFHRPCGPRPPRWRWLASCSRRSPPDPPSPASAQAWHLPSCAVAVAASGLVELGDLLRAGVLVLSAEEPEPWGAQVRQLVDQVADLVCGADHSAAQSSLAARLDQSQEHRAETATPPHRLPSKCANVES